MIFDKMMSKAVILGSMFSVFVTCNAFAANGTVLGNNVNVRNNPGTGGQIIARINSGDVVNVIGKTGSWYQVLRQNGEFAYLSKSYVKGEGLEAVPEVNVPEIASQAVTNTYAMVVCDGGLRLRSEPNVTSQSIETVPQGYVVDVTETGDEWIKVKTDTGNTGFLSKEFVAIRTGEKPSRSNSSKAQQIIDYAEQFLGTPYSYGGTNLGSGVDCSGFVYSVMNHFGISLNRSSRGMASNGVAVSKDQLMMGDLVLFDTTGVNDGNISHVGIYIGNGDYIHSSSGRAYSVIISNLNDDYSARTYVTARRVLR